MTTPQGATKRHSGRPACRPLCCARLAWASRPRVQFCRAITILVHCCGQPRRESGGLLVDAYLQVVQVLRGGGVAFDAGLQVAPQSADGVLETQSLQPAIL